jgi:hypothetical protein
MQQLTNDCHNRGRTISPTRWHNSFFDIKRRSQYRDKTVSKIGWLANIYGKGKWSTRRKPASVTFSPLQILQDLARDRTVATAVENRPLTTWAVATSQVEFKHMFSKASYFKIRFIDKKKLRGLSPQANYADRVSAACWRRIEGATYWAWRIPTAVFSIFYTGAATFSSK